MFDLSFLAFYFVHMQSRREGASSGNIKKKRYAYLVSREPRKFKETHKEGIVVLTSMAWAAISAFVCMGFPRTFDLERGIVVPAFFLPIKQLLMFVGTTEKQNFMVMKNFTSKFAKKLLMFFGVLMMVGVCEMKAQTFIVDGITYEISYKGAILTKGVDKEVVVIPEEVVYEGYIYKVTAIDVNAFRNCRSMTSIDIPFFVESIGNHAFLNCSSLVSIIIPSSVISIDHHAFTGCSSLTFINILSSVRSIGRYAFSGCDSLEEITCYAVVPPSLVSTGNTDVIKKVTVKVPNEAIEAYRTAEVWKDFYAITGFDVTDIKDVKTWKQNVPVEIYTLNGLKVTEPMRGQVNVFKYADGSIQKIILK